jgi:hypothetical protein
MVFIVEIFAFISWDRSGQDAVRVAQIFTPEH